MVFASQGGSPRDANTIKTAYTIITDLNHVLLNDLHSACVQKQNEEL